MARGNELHFDIDMNKLKGRIIEKCGTLQSFAAAAGMSTSTIGKKLDGRSAWDQREILTACEILSIEHDDILGYFFNEKVITS